MIASGKSTRLETLDDAIARGLADAQGGRLRKAEDVFDRLEAKYRAMDSDGDLGLRRKRSDNNDDGRRRNS